MLILLQNKNLIPTRKWNHLNNGLFSNNLIHTRFTKNFHLKKSNNAINPYLFLLTSRKKLEQLVGIRTTWMTSTPTQKGRGLFPFINLGVAPPVPKGAWLRMSLWGHALSHVLPILVYWSLSFWQYFFSEFSISLLCLLHAQLKNN